MTRLPLLVLIVCLLYMNFSIHAHMWEAKMIFWPVGFFWEIIFHFYLVLHGLCFWYRCPMLQSILFWYRWFFKCDSAELLRLNECLLMQRVTQSFSSLSAVNTQSAKFCNRNSHCWVGNYVNDRWPCLFWIMPFIK